MKTKMELLLIALYILISCNKVKDKPEVIEVTPATPKQEKVDQLVYQDITDLNEYKGFTKVLGMILDGTDKALVYIQKDNLQVLVLEQIIETDTSMPNFKILDKVEVTADSSKLFSELSECELINEGNNGEFIFGLVNNQEKEYFDTDHILNVWKIDLKNNKFKEIPSKEVKCLNQWFGYDG
ncbi:hypothetical protein ACQY1Q_09255 [Tenacibaculum sp. TC6]|uniref:hypothetical protein n=1 Tax=Tenacibaculum sp. TC6 TaxID=3423223 RepID=UPI003D36E087